MKPSRLLPCWLARVGVLCLFFGLVAPLSLLGCNRSPPPVRTWSAEEHGGAKEKNQAIRKPESPEESRLALAEIAWTQKCALCHGAEGKGDTPQGRFMGAADLTLPGWQEGITNEAIATSIRKGKGKMPPFDLSEATLTGLVEQIRAFRSLR